MAEISPRPGLPVLLQGRPELEQLTGEAELHWRAALQEMVRAQEAMEAGQSALLPLLRCITQQAAAIGCLQNVSVLLHGVLGEKVNEVKQVVLQARPGVPVPGMGCPWGRLG